MSDDEEKAFIATDTLFLALDGMGADQKVAISEMLKHYAEEFKHVAHVDPSAVAHAVHLSTDKAIEAQKPYSEHVDDIQCRRGCDACCHLWVSAWPHEAALLLAVAEGEGIALDRPRLERQAAKGEEHWQELPKQDRACVFLSDAGECRAYEYRPNSCRKHFVVSDPAYCDTMTYPNHRVQRWFSPEAEAIESAAITVFGGAGLAELLLGAMNK